jgi:hypothetical protein
VPILKLISKESVKGVVEGEDKRLTQLKSLVSDCGLSQTTLEEVFMIVTGKKEVKEKKKLSEIADSGSSFDETYSPKKFEERKDYYKDEEETIDELFKPDDLRRSTVHKE